MKGSRVEGLCVFSAVHGYSLKIHDISMPNHTEITRNACTSGRDKH